jgi:hypothetical protein
MVKKNDDNLEMTILDLLFCGLIFSFILGMLVMIYNVAMQSIFGGPDLITALSGAEWGSEEYGSLIRRYVEIIFVVWAFLTALSFVVFRVLGVVRLPLKKFGEWCVRQAALKRS